MRALSKEHKSMLKLALLLTVFLFACTFAKADASAKIKLNKTSVTLAKGKTCYLKVKGISKGTKVKWRSQNRAVVRMNQKGKVKTVGTGTAVVTATVQGEQYSCTVKVIQPVTKVKLNMKKLTINTGKLQPLTAVVSPAGATNKKLKWRSSNKKVARVTSKGVIRALAPGTTTITASAKDGSGKKATCKVTVTNKKIKVTSVSLNKKKASVQAGKMLALISNVQPVTATNAKVSWASSNKAVAVVNSNGLVTAVSPGKATITATAKDGSAKKASCEVTVTYGGSKGEQLLSYLRKYEAQLQADKAKGIKWHYYRGLSAEGKKYPLTWQQAMEPGALKVTDCASFVRWGLKDMGVLGAKESFWDTGPNENNGNDILYFTTPAAKNSIYKNCNVISVNRKAGDLIADGVLKPGDVCTWKGMGHTNVYAGNGQWFDAGHNNNGHYEGKLYIFDTWGPITSPYLMNTKVDCIIRIKE